MPLKKLITFTMFFTCWKTNIHNKKMRWIFFLYSLKIFMDTFKTSVYMQNSFLFSFSKTSMINENVRCLWFLKMKVKKKESIFATVLNSLYSLFSVRKINSAIFFNFIKSHFCNMFMTHWFKHWPNLPETKVSNGLKTKFFFILKLKL